MRPIDFPGSNITLAKDQPPYLPLPGQVFGDTLGTLLTCWELTPEELEQIASTGKLWITVLTFNQPLQPMQPSTDDPIPPGLRPKPVAPDPTKYKVVAVTNRDDDQISDRVLATNMDRDAAQDEADRLNKQCDPDGMWYYKIRNMDEKDYVFQP